MMKQIIALTLVAFVFLSSTCKKAMQAPDTELEKIFGKWNWISTSGGFAGKSTTPLNMDYSVRVEFSDEGIYRIYRNDTLINRKKFSFSKKKSIRTDKLVWVVSFVQDTPVYIESPFAMEVLFEGKDTLMLNECVYDGFQYVYSRIK